jgi:hypothetical protein
VVREPSFDVSVFSLRLINLLKLFGWYGPLLLPFISIKQLPISMATGSILANVGKSQSYSLYVSIGSTSEQESNFNVSVFCLRLLHLLKRFRSYCPFLLPFISIKQLPISRATGSILANGGKSQSFSLIVGSGSTSEQESSFDVSVFSLRLANLLKRFGSYRPYCYLSSPSSNFRSPGRLGPF